MIQEVGYAMFGASTIGTALKKKAPRASAFLKQGVISCGTSLFMAKTGLPLMETMHYKSCIQSISHSIKNLNKSLPKLVKNTNRLFDKAISMIFR